MISRLRGTLIEKTMPKIVVEIAGGIGYEVEVPLTTFEQLPDISHSIVLYTHMVVREDAQKLFGFYRARDRELFITLIKVNGVGPKIALAILSTIDADTLVRAVINEDEAILERVPGVGKRTAQRLLVELRDRLNHWGSESHDVIASESIVTDKPHRKAMDEAISALVSLGYKPQQASRVVSKIYIENTPSETLIREALKSLSAVS